MGAASGENRIRGMIEARPDWVISRQRAWGVPITVFRHKETGEVIPSAKFAKSKELIARIAQGLRREGRRRLVRGGRTRALPRRPRRRSLEWEQVRDILDVWFDSGSTHAFTLEDPQALPRPRRHQARARRRRTTASCIWKAPTSTAAGSSPRSGILRHARARALRRRADPRLHPRREGRGEDVEVARATRSSPQERDEDLGRRHPAPVGGLRRLFENDIRFGPAIVQALDRGLPQAAGTRCAGCSARSRIWSRPTASS